MRKNQKISFKESENFDKKNFLKTKNWEKENQKAIDSYNQRIKGKGLFSDGLRLF
jgi:post-segregation antitoxin (ccd killing protein)